MRAIAKIIFWVLFGPFAWGLSSIITSKEEFKAKKPLAGVIQIICGISILIPYLCGLGLIIWEYIRRINEGISFLNAPGYAFNAYGQATPFLVLPLIIAFIAICVGFFCSETNKKLRVATIVVLTITGIIALPLIALGIYMLFAGNTIPEDEFLRNILMFGQPKDANVSSIYIGIIIASLVGVVISLILMFKEEGVNVISLLLGVLNIVISTLFLVFLLTSTGVMLAIGIIVVCIAIPAIGIFFGSISDSMLNMLGDTLEENAIRKEKRAKIKAVSKKH